jgi:hypothetical protein
MAGDGSGEFGGGGSIEWSIDVNDGSIPAVTPKPNNPKGYRQQGKDREGISDDGRFFVIRIKPGNIRLGKNGDIFVAVQIQKNTPGQIKVEWSFTQAELDALGGNFSAV